MRIRQDCRAGFLYVLITRKGGRPWDSRLSFGRGPRGVPASIPLSKLPFAVGAVKPSPFFATPRKWGTTGVLVRVCTRLGFLEKIEKSSTRSMPKRPRTPASGFLSGTGRYPRPRRASRARWMPLRGRALAVELKREDGERQVPTDAARCEGLGDSFRVCIEVACTD